jgi:hypothetical protein
MKRHPKRQGENKDVGLVAMILIIYDLYADIKTGMRRMSCNWSYPRISWSHEECLHHVPPPPSLNWVLSDTFIRHHYPEVTAAQGTVKGWFSVLFF